MNDGSDLYQLYLGNIRGVLVHTDLMRKFKNYTVVALLNRAIHWYEWTKSRTGKKWFYKFYEECDHPLYRPGDSWEEEIGTSEKSIREALKKIGFKLGESTRRRIAGELEARLGREATLPELQAEFDRQRREALIVYRVDHHRVTHYTVNENAVKKLLKEVSSKSKTKVEEADFPTGETAGIAITEESSGTIVAAKSPVQQQIDYRETKSPYPLAGERDKFSSTTTMTTMTTMTMKALTKLDLQDLFDAVAEASLNTRTRTEKCLKLQSLFPVMEMLDLILEKPPETPEQLAPLWNRVRAGSNGVSRMAQGLFAMFYATTLGGYKIPTDLPGMVGAFDEDPERALDNWYDDAGASLLGALYRIGGKHAWTTPEDAAAFVLDEYGPYAERLFRETGYDHVSQHIYERQGVAT